MRYLFKQKSLGKPDLLEKITDSEFQLLLQRIHPLSYHWSWEGDLNSRAIEDQIWYSLTVIIAETIAYTEKKPDLKKKKNHRFRVPTIPASDIPTNQSL